MILADKYPYPNVFKTRKAAIAMPITRREFMAMVRKEYKSTVLAVTDLIIKTYEGLRCRYKNTVCGELANYELNQGDDIRVLTRDFCDLSKGHENCPQFLVNELRREKK